MKYGWMDGRVDRPPLASISMGMGFVSSTCIINWISPSFPFPFPFPLCLESGAAKSAVPPPKPKPYLTENHSFIPAILLATSPCDLLSICPSVGSRVSRTTPSVQISQTLGQCLPCCHHHDGNALPSFSSILSTLLGLGLGLCVWLLWCLL